MGYMIDLGYRVYNHCLGTLYVDPGSPSISGAVTRRQLVVYCILLLLILLTGQVVLASV